MTQSNRVIPKGPKRLAVEAALMHATAENPMSAQDVSDASGVEISITRTHLGNCLNADLAYNANAGHRCVASYVWGRRPVVRHNAERVSVMTQPSYTGERNTVHRPGAMDAFSLRSRVGDSTVERKRPALIGGRALEAVGVRGGGG